MMPMRKEWMSWADAGFIPLLQNWWAVGGNILYYLNVIVYNIQQKSAKNEGKTELL